MTERMKKLWLIMLVIGLLSGLIKVQYAVGYVLGSIASLIIYKRIESFVDGVIGSGSPGGSAGNFMINYALMAFVLVISAVRPNISNIFAAALGLMSVKVTIILDNFLKKGGSVNEH